MGASPDSEWRALPPSRYYQDGVPPLRPEFLYPLPEAKQQ
jgi:hypothetical protein